MDAIDNETTLQSLIDAQYALLESEQAIFADLQVQKLTLISNNSNEVQSKGKSGMAGSDNFAYLTITQQMTASAARMKELGEELLRLCEIKNNRFPWIITEQRRSLIHE